MCSRWRKFRTEDPARDVFELIGEAGSVGNFSDDLSGTGGGPIGARDRGLRVLCCEGDSRLAASGGVNTRREGPATGWGVAKGVEKVNFGVNGWIGESDDVWDEERLGLDMMMGDSGVRFRRVRGDLWFRLLCWLLGPVSSYGHLHSRAARFHTPWTKCENVSLARMITSLPTAAQRERIFSLSDPAMRVTSLRRSPVRCCLGALSGRRGSAADRFLWFIDHTEFCKKWTRCWWGE
jgi:hypothetical protein